MIADLFVWWAKYVAMGAAALMLLFLLVVIVDVTRVWRKYR